MAGRPTVKFEVKGAKTLQRALKAAGDDLSDLKEIHLEGARIVEQEAYGLAPVRSGTLRSSLRSAGQKRQAVVRAGKASVPYAGVIHFGWPGHNIAPQPFLYDAVDARRDEVFENYEKAVGKVLKRKGLK